MQILGEAQYGESYVSLVLRKRAAWRDRYQNLPSSRHGEIVPNSVDIAKMGIAISAGEVFYIEDGGLGCGPRIRSALADFLPVEIADLGECVPKQLSAKGSGHFHLERINTTRIDLSHRFANDPARRRTSERTGCA